MIVSLNFSDHTLLPILLYGCQILGFENCACIENVDSRFLRSILGVKRSTPKYMVYYGELGRFPLIIYVKSRMISYWCNMLYGNNTNKLSSRIYNTLLLDYTNIICK